MREWTTYLNWSIVRSFLHNISSQLPVRRPSTIRGSLSLIVPSPRLRASAVKLVPGFLRALSVSQCLSGGFLVLIAALFFAAPAFAQSVPPLGAAQTFAVLAGTTVTSTGPSLISGNIGVSPGTAVTGFPPGAIQNGQIYSGGGSLAGPAESSALDAYNNLKGQACVPANNLSGKILGVTPGAVTLAPGVYCFDTSAQLTTTLNLNDGGDPNAIFIFQIGTTLTTASGSQVLMSGGGRGTNVYWQIGSSATIGTFTTFRGNIIANTSITLTTSASSTGRFFAINGAVTMDTNTIDAVPVTGGVLLGPSGFAGAVGPTNSNDDYTNLGVNTGISGVAPGGTTTASGTATFVNTIQNTGNADDTYTLTAPTVPNGFLVEISSTSAAAGYTTIHTAANVSSSASVAVPLSAPTATLWVRITAPAGATVLAAYPTTIHAVSSLTPATTNDTIDRLYTGFVQITKSQTVTNALNVVPSMAAGSTPVPGATIAYVDTYLNITTTGGANNALVNASSIVILDPIPANTDFKVGSATSNPPAGITVLTEYFNGTAWTYTPASAGGGAPANFDRNVQQVRFTLTGNLLPTATGNTGFTVRIR
jgi:hypothetical protein